MPPRFNLAAPRSFFGVIVAAYRFLFVESWRFLIVAFVLITILETVISQLIDYFLKLDETVDHNDIIYWIKLIGLLIFSYVISFYLTQLQIAFSQYSTAKSPITVDFLKKARPLFWLLPLYLISVSVGMTLVFYAAVFIADVKPISNTTILGLFGFSFFIVQFHFILMPQVVLETDEDFVGVYKASWHYLSQSVMRSIGYLFFHLLKLLVVIVVYVYLFSPFLFKISNEPDDRIITSINKLLNIFGVDSLSLFNLLSNLFVSFLSTLEQFYYNTVFAIETRRLMQPELPDQPDQIDEIGSHLL